MGVAQTFEYIDIGDVFGDKFYQDELVKEGSSVVSSSESEVEPMNLVRIKTLPTA